MSTSLLVQTVVAGLIAAGALVAFAARFSKVGSWLPAVAATLAADQATKWAAQRALREGPAVELLGGRLVLSYDLNPMQGFGGAFGGILLVTGLVVVLGAMLYRGLAERGYRMALPSAVACGLMAGGFAGVALDRAIHRAAVDLVHFGPNGAYLYNVADFAVFVAFVLLALRLLQLAPEGWRRRRIIWSELAAAGEESA